jgi:hypothetical protein
MRIFYLVMVMVLVVALGALEMVALRSTLASPPYSDPDSEPAWDDR